MDLWSDLYEFVCFWIFLWRFLILRGCVKSELVFGSYFEVIF